jgi:hypothetical protein
VFPGRATAPFDISTFVMFMGAGLALLAAFTVVGAPVRLLIRQLSPRPADAVPTPLYGIAVIALASYYWMGPHGATKPLVRAVGVVCVVTTTAIVGFFVVRRREVLRDRMCSRRFRHRVLMATLCFAGIAAVFVVNETQLFTRPNMTVLSLGNNDAPAYGLISQHMLDEGPSRPGHIAGYDAGKRQMLFGGGACGVLAGAAAMVGQDVFHIMSPLLFAVIVLGAFAAALLLYDIFDGEHPILAAVLATLGFSGLYTAYVIAQWFFGQLLGMVLVIGAVAAIRAGTRWSDRRNLLGAALVAGLLIAANMWVYAHMAVVGCIALLPVAVCAFDTPRRFLQSALRGGVVFTGAVLVAVAAGPGLLRAGIDTTKELDHAVAGWPLPGVLPTDMLGFQSSEVATRTSITIAVSVLLVAALVAIAVVLWRRKLGGLVLPMVGGIASILVTYGVAYHHEGGPTYRQFKWVSFFVPVFVVFALALVALGVRELARRWPSAWRAGGVALTAYAAVVLTLASGAGFPLRFNGGAQVSADEITLRGHPRLRSVSSVHVNLPAYWESMWAVYFLRDVPTTIENPTYYSTAAPAPGSWELERNDAPLPAGAKQVQLNATYRLVKLAS